MDMKTITDMLPAPSPQPIGVVVPVMVDTMQGAAKSFRKEYLEPHDRTFEISNEDLDLMAGAFLALMGRLPIRSIDLVRWIAEGGMHDPAAIAEYAEGHLGMEPIDTPVSLGRKRVGARR